jgi:ComEC/Rec2-related protein
LRGLSIDPFLLLYLGGYWLYLHQVSPRKILLFFAGGLCILFLFPSKNSFRKENFYAYGKIVSVNERQEFRMQKVVVDLLIRPEESPRCVEGWFPSRWEISPHREGWVKVQLQGDGTLPKGKIRVEPGLFSEKEKISPLLYDPPRAFLLGFLYNISPPPFSEIETIRKAGLGHLLAISGIHVGVILLFLFGVLRIFLFLLPWSFLRNLTFPLPHYLLSIGALAGTWFYIYKVGFPPSAVRAGGIFTLALLFRLIIRREIPYDLALLILLDLLLLLSPCTVYTLSFSMSITAIAYLFPLLFVQNPFFRIGMGVTLPAIGTAPYLLDFQEIPLSTPLANLLGIPLFTFFLFPTALVSEFFSYWGIPFLAEKIYDLYRYGFYLLWKISDFTLKHTFFLPEGKPLLEKDLLILYGSLPVLFTLMIQKILGMKRQRTSSQYFL